MELSDTIGMSMPTRLIRVFVSSPGDVAEERQVLDDAVASINRFRVSQANGLCMPLPACDTRKRVLV
jgi:hypothetical protein